MLRLQHGRPFFERLGVRAAVAALIPLAAWSVPGSAFAAAAAG